MRKALSAVVFASVLAWTSTARSEAPWREGDPIPEGHHTEKTFASSVTWTGAVMFGVPYALSFVVACYSYKAEFLPLLLPAVGPFFQMGISYVAHGPDQAAAFTVLAIDGILQSVGLTLGLLGASLPQVKLVKDTLLLPVGPLGTPGASIQATF